MTDAQVDRVNIKGFGRDSTDLVREMETFGWVFRPSNHGVVGRAPDSKTTISIARNIRRSNHSFQRAWGDFRRWLKATHPELNEITETYIEERTEAKDESSPVLAGILDRRTMIRTVGRLADIIPTGDEEDPASSTQTTKKKKSEEATSMATITHTQPMTPKTSDGVLRVIKRTWSTGRMDFACAFAGCTVTSHNPRSVSQHYGAVHTRPVETYLHHGQTAVDTVLAQVAPTPQPAPEPVEPVVNLDPPEEHPITKQMIDERYDVVSGDLNDDHDVVVAIRQLVSGPLMERVKILAEQVNVLTKERDEAQEALAKIQSDWDALRSLLGGVRD